MAPYRKALCGLLIGCVLSGSLPRTGEGALIPAQLDQGSSVVAVTENGQTGVTRVSSAQLESAAIKLQQAGLTPEEAGKRLQSIDRVELAQLETTDLQQKGGDGLGAVLVVLLIIAVTVWIVRNI